MTSFIQSSGIKVLSACSVALTLSLISQPCRAGVEIGGNVEMTTNVKNAAITAVASGERAKAVNNLNAVHGHVKVGGNVTTKLDIKNTAISAGAFGAGAVAENNINAIRGD